MTYSNANFTPELKGYSNVKPFRFWCQKVLPLVYDDSLSYYELLCKVIDYLNNVISDLSTTEDNVGSLLDAYNELQGYVNDYFTNLNVQEEINNKLDSLVEDGTLTELIGNYIDPRIAEIQEELDDYEDEMTTNFNGLQSATESNLQQQNDKIFVLEGRMDTFTNLPNGSTSGDAELQDIRVAFDGTVYPTAGDAVRQQIENICETTENLFYKTGATRSETRNGVTITINDDQSITFNGTATSSFNIQIMGSTNYEKNVDNETYLFARNKLSGTGTRLVYFAYRAVGTTDNTTINTGEPVTFSTDSSVYLRINNSAVFVNDTFNFMVYKGSTLKPYIQHITGVDYYSRNKINEVNETVTTDISAIENNVDNIVTDGNNLLKLDDYSVTYRGVTITIKNGIVTLNGDTTGYGGIRLKLTNGYDAQATEIAEWKTESVNFFEVGKTYCYGVKVISGEFPSTVGFPSRYDETSILSVTVPRAVITTIPQYTMLYIPSGQAVNCSVIPFIINAYTANNLFVSTLSNSVKKTDKLLPLREFNYFQVAVNSNVFTSESDSVLNQDSETNVNTQCVLTLPTNYDLNGNPTPIIMFCHGRSDRVIVDDWCENDSDKLTLIRSFTNAGYGVFDVDATRVVSAGAVDVGCPQLMESYIKAFNYIKNNYNVEDRIYLYSYSFGTFAAMNMLCWYPSLVKTACLSAMRASIESVFNRGTPYNIEIAQNFGFTDQTGATYEADKLLGYDPYADIANGKLYKKIPPIKALTSSSDTLELTEVHTLINAWKNSGNKLAWREVTGLSHRDICYLTPAGLRNEVVMWFNRYK